MNFKIKQNLLIFLIFNVYWYKKVYLKKFLLFFILRKSKKQKEVIKI